ncbi:PLP-dependent aminotransferase family protein [Oharaeibacter diazotrophicus]|uniref:GntR family transcriptional regulator n=3 Tax=Oharaeibacter diazotrophicus TaxID=1920512 RepID=A0A4R6RLT4_9HYPH|nr:PLP-dependent aminotransferase family protein [Oharaeibacter diazotrophicus]TDP87629.1 GntR family transcriptional regulator [Oharaeibacter diazotrophicus]BBE74788.1 putative HTH-type transcriptional regulator YjiR [Pleomorphomonas sp. SM30]GLS77170.1 GntR family transcriptional regulator [Oharaeibacter diazotrophicus]
MRLASPWTPRLAGSGLPHERLAAAIAEDLQSGAIAPGDRLPPQRDVAWRLGLAVGTVGKAYAALERRGLVESVHGRGSFAAGLKTDDAGPADLAVNRPPQMLDDRLLAATLATVARRLDADAFGGYAPSAGRPVHRAMMARWLARQGLPAAPETVLLTNGAQHALSVALDLACPPGTLLLVERFTYPAVPLFARHRGVEVRGLAVDGEGMRPDALAEALADAARAGRRAALYLMPTVQNPTAAAMGPARRRAIADLVARHDATIVEDEVYAGLAEAPPPPIAALAPERTLHVTGLSKVLSPGLRIGALVVPRALAAAAAERVQAACTSVSVLSCLIMETWFADGTADVVARAIREEARARLALARAKLPDAKFAAGGYHLWMPMPTAAAAEFVARAAAAGVLLMSARAPLADPADPVGGVRVSVGGPARPTLERALDVLAGLSEPPAMAAI